MPTAVKILKTQGLAIARVCHIVNKAYCEATGDYSEPSWESTPMSAKEALLNEVRQWVNFPDSLPQSHGEQRIKDHICRGVVLALGQI